MSAAQEAEAREVKRPESEREIARLRAAIIELGEAVEPFFDAAFGLDSGAVSAFNEMLGERYFVALVRIGGTGLMR